MSIFTWVALVKVMIGRCCQRDIAAAYRGRRQVDRPHILVEIGPVLERDLAQGPAGMPASCELARREIRMGEVEHIGRLRPFETGKVRNTIGRRNFIGRA
ncbi:MAG: hypothetical protein J0626_09005, partial [Rhodospirillaceae bacterium]|nr:hypothetical protein [Rhodospirillaceae bacterium]